MKPKAEASAFGFSFTAIPNVLIDEVMPTLKDTEWRLLCMIVRQTLGRSEKGGKRKQRDWMSQSQLIARTGRNSAALSAAINGLVNRHFIEVQSENGELLLTPQERRRYRGHLYFGLSPEMIQQLTKQTPKTPLGKANRTKEKEDKRNLYKGRENTRSCLSGLDFRQRDCHQAKLSVRDPIIETK